MKTCRLKCCCGCCSSLSIVPGDPELYDTADQSRVYPLVNQSRVYPLVKGETIVVNFTVRANPKPVLVKWTFYGQSEIDLLKNNSDRMDEYRFINSSDIYHFEFSHFNVTDNRTGLYSAVLANGVRYSLNLTYTLSTESESGNKSSLLLFTFIESKPAF